MAKREVSVDPVILELEAAPPQEKLRDDLATAVDRAMNKLLPRQAEVIRLHVDERLTFEQIAEHYDISRTSAHDRYRRAKDTLRKHLLENPMIEELMSDG